MSLFSASLLSTSYANNASQDEYFLDPALGDIPHVLSAVRLHQPTAEVPASITVLDSGFIRSTGAKNIQDLLRYVPGMLVIPEPFDNSDSVVYHGGPILYPKSMEVLIDGRAAYSTGLSAVGWNQLSVAVEEIQRIEVVRGPNSTTYGTNAFQAVVNIITKHPSDTKSEHYVTIQAGQNNDHYLYGQSGFDFAGGQWRLNAVDKGTDHLKDSEEERLSCDTPCPDRRDTQNINLRGYYELDKTQSLDAALMLMRAERKLPRYILDNNEVSEQQIEVGVRYFNDIAPDHNLKVSAFSYQYQRHHEQGFYNISSGYFDPDLFELYKINPKAADQIAAGLSPSAIDLSDPEQAALLQALSIKYSNPEDFLIPLSGVAHARAIERRADIEIQDTYAITPKLILLSGIGYRYDEVASESYYNQSISNRSLRLFGNINWRVSPNLSLHTGFMNEESDMDRSVLSYRAAANYLISPVESFRLVYSRASKTAEFFEQHANWSYRVDNLKTDSSLSGEYFYQTLISDEDLTPQNIDSYEVGYYGLRPEIKLEWDIRLFHENLTDIIYLWPAITSTEIYSDNKVEFYGFEWQIKKSLGNNQLRYIGAFTKSNSNVEEGLTEKEILAIYSPLSQALSVQTNWGKDISSMLTLFWSKNVGAPSANSDESVELKRLILNVFGTFNKPISSEVSWGVIVEHDVSNNPPIFHGSPYEKQTRFNLEIGVHF